jgi:hypothetical protein
MTDSWTIPLFPKWQNPWQLTFDDRRAKVRTEKLEPKWPAFKVDKLLDPNALPRRDTLEPNSTWSRMDTLLWQLARP